MTTSPALTGLQLRSTITPNGELELTLLSVETPSPGPDEVVVRIEATPINPSDIGLLFGAADISTAKLSGTLARPVVTAQVPQRLMKGMAGRLGESMPVGNEGAGIVVAAGSSEAAQALLGKTVAVLGGAMYAQYRTIAASQCLVLPEGTTPEALDALSLPTGGRFAFDIDGNAVALFPTEWSMNYFAQNHPAIPLAPLAPPRKR